MAEDPAAPCSGEVFFLNGLTGPFATSTLPGITYFISVGITFVKSSSLGSTLTPLPLNPVVTAGLATTEESAASFPSVTPNEFFNSWVWCWEVVLVVPPELNRCAGGLMAADESVVISIGGKHCVY